MQFLRVNVTFYDAVKMIHDVIATTYPLIRFSQSKVVLHSNVQIMEKIPKNALENGW